MRRAARRPTTDTDEICRDNKMSDIPFPLRVIFTDAQYTLDAHVKAQTDAPFKYMATLQALDRNGVQLADGLFV